MDIAATDPNQLALLILQNATSGNWRALAAIAVMASVFAIRQWALAPGALGRFAALAWFKSDKGGVALNFIVSALGGVGNALYAKQPLTKELLLASAVNACIAAGVFVSIKRLAGRPAAIPNAPVAPADDKPASAPPVALIPLLLITALLPLQGCAFMRAVGIKIASCAAGTVPSAVTAILPDVEGALKSESVNWQSDLQAIGTKAGLDALGCAIKSIVGPMHARKMSLDAVGQRKLARGDEYLNRLGVE